MSGINAVNGVATIDLTTSGQFLGSTCPEGMFPPIGHTYRQFVFSPKKGTNGLLIFKSKIVNTDSYNFWPYYWKDGKLIVEYEHQYNPVNPFIRSGYGDSDFGFMVQYRPDRVFVTQIPVNLVEGVEYLLVDHMTMFRFISGKIDRRQLARAAQVVKAQAKKDEGLRAQIEDLKKQLVLFALAEKFDMRSATIARLESRLKDRDTFLFNLRVALLIKSGWLLRLAMTKDQKKILKGFAFND
ncbi:MAG: hypothetical protein AAB737_00760 [Patescibacteria group bacterium]